MHKAQESEQSEQRPPWSSSGFSDDAASKQSSTSPAASDASEGAIPLEPNIKRTASMRARIHIGPWSPG